MPRYRLLRLIAEGLALEGAKELLGRVPFVKLPINVGQYVARRMREISRDERIAAVEELARADQHSRRAMAEEMAAEAVPLAEELTPADQAEARDVITAILVQVPGLIRRSLARAEDPNGVTVPDTCRPEEPAQIAEWLPAERPQFRPGQGVPNRDDWVLLEILGGGGFGQVWLAQHRHITSRRNAIKFCTNSESREALLGHEARLVNTLMTVGRHPGIVPLEDANLSADPPWLAFEYVDGGDLIGHQADWPAEGRVELATRLILSVARTIAVCHAAGVIHRDLKPANILMNGDQPRVSDFGIGHAAASATLTQAVVPTPSGIFAPTAVRGAATLMYASPQQRRGHAPDPRDDVFSLGVIWYQLLVGDLTETPGSDFADELAELGVDERLIGVLGRCIATKAERRWPDGKAVVEAFESASAEPEDGDDLAAILAGTADQIGAARERVRVLSERHDYARAAEQLESIPEHLRDAAELDRLRELAGSVERLNGEIREAVQQSRYPGLKANVGELLRLTPHDPRMRRLLEQLEKMKLPPEPGELLTLTVHIPEPERRAGELLTLPIRVPEPKRKPGELVTLRWRPVPEREAPPHD